jgi:hypothetical protein
MIAGKTVSEGSGDCLFPVTELPTLRKIIQPAKLAPGAPGTLAGFFATSVAPDESREDGRMKAGMPAGRSTRERMAWLTNGPSGSGMTPDL